MIYTVTFNPSIDYIVEVKQFKEDQVNRTSHELLLPGGKGINVSIVLNNLGVENTALGFVAGFTGKEIKRRCEEDFNISTAFIELKDGYSRINFKMKSDLETEVNGNGPMIKQEDIDELMMKLQSLTSDDILVLSGSIPSSLPDDMYALMMKELKHTGVKIVVDATGQLLMNVLQFQPFLIKPNNHELAEMFHVKLSGEEDIITYAKKLQELGAKNVLISMAKDGAILVDEYGNVHKSQAPKGIVKNSVGAGDSMVAGFIAGYVESQDYKHALKKGICTGSASAFSKNLATLEEVNALYEQIKD